MRTMKMRTMKMMKGYEDEEKLAVEEEFERLRDSGYVPDMPDM